MKRAALIAAAVVSLVPALLLLAFGTIPMPPDWAWQLTSVGLAVHQGYGWGRDHERRKWERQVLQAKLREEKW